MHKSLYSFIIITRRKLKSEEKFLNMIKGNYEKSRANIILKSEIVNYLTISSRAK